MARKKRHAFTLVELLVVIVIIAILVSLLLPAVQSAREAARNLQCRNHLKQLATAAKQHTAVRGHFPSGGWGWGWVGDADRGFGANQPGGWFYNSLPYMEQLALHDLGLGMSESEKKAAHAERISTPVAGLNCPSRRRTVSFTFDHPYRGANFNDVTTVTRTDYASNAGDKDCHPGYMGLWSSHCGNSDCGPSSAIDSETVIAKANHAASFDANGISYPMSQVPEAKVTDGLSSTYMIGEKYLIPDHYESGQDVGDNENMHMGFNEDVARWTFVPPARDRRGAAIRRAFGSVHLTGFNVAMCDGSVHRINYSIDPEIHRNLGVRDDDQKIDVSKL
jgi:prepilin-type N-terminal cleavage/methylation domain-containing protein/prepilin-type processing-associated H-X9-DG protein